MLFVLGKGMLVDIRLAKAYTLITDLGFPYTPEEYALESRCHFAGGENKWEI